MAVFKISADGTIEAEDKEDACLQLSGYFDELSYMSEEEALNPLSSGSIKIEEVPS